MVKIGYARTAKGEVSLDQQIDALRNAGCTEIIAEEWIAGGTLTSRMLAKACATVQPGDTLVVCQLDRLGLTLINLVEFITALDQRKVYFQSLVEEINTADPQRRHLVDFMAALSGFERSLYGALTRAGMEIARRKGKTIGRPRSLTPEQIEEARKTLLDPNASVNDLARRLNVSKRTLARALEE